MARRRTLRPDEEEIWHAVARTARAMHPKPQSLPRKDEARDAINPFHPKEPVQHLLPQSVQLPSFRLGEKVRSKPKLDLAPSLTESLSSSLQMDAKAYGRMTRGKLVPEARIDLHGMTLAEAHPELVRFILNAQSQGFRLVLVITGKGKAKSDHGPIPSRIGVLRHQVPQWLRQPPLGPAILQVSEAHLRHGGAGAYYVYMRRSR